MSRPAAPVRMGNLDDALKYAEFLETELDRLATALSLAQTEIKGHMRVKDELKSRIAELEANLALYYSQPGVKWAAAWASCERDRRELEARIAELEKERDELKHHIAVTEALKDRA